MPSNDDIQKSKQDTLIICGDCKGNPSLEISHQTDYVRCQYCKTNIPYSWTRTQCPKCGEIGLYSTDERTALAIHIMDEWNCNENITITKNQDLDTRNSDEIELDALGEHIMAAGQNMKDFIKENLSEKSFEKWLKFNPN